MNFVQFNRLLYLPEVVVILHDKPTLGAAAKALDRPNAISGLIPLCDFNMRFKWMVSH